MKIVKVANRGRNVISTSTLTLDSNCNKSIGGADRKDALIGNYLSVRKTRKWAGGECSFAFYRRSSPQFIYFV